LLCCIFFSTLFAFLEFLKKNIMKITLFYQITVLLLFSGYITQAQIGIGTSNPNKSAVLDLTSSNKGLLLPRIAKTASIVTPVDGMLIFDVSEKCLKAFQNGAWTGCGLVPVASVTTLTNCSAAFNPVSAEASVAYTGSTTSSYTGGNGAAYPAASYASTGIIGLTLSLAAGTLATGSGTLSYTVSGTPSGDGTASFSISFGGQTCTKTISVAAASPTVATLTNCSDPFNPVSAKASVAYTGSTTLSYSGANGAAYPAASYPSTGITGLTLSLAAGTLATWSGTLLYAVSGTPSGEGTASFSISFGGQTCTKMLLLVVLM
jgi:hypothetical protein